MLSRLEKTYMQVDNVGGLACKGETKATRLVAAIGPDLGPAIGS